MFTRTQKSGAGTSLQVYIDASYARVRELFGDPDPMPSGDGKVSTKWTFVDAQDQVVTLYEYKETNVYSRNLPSVEEFRALRTYEWHIGAARKQIAMEFREWLSGQL